LGVKLAYPRAGIVVALIFVGIPFVARAVQPVLTQLEPAYEEAARLMGAGRARTFFRVVLPELTPAALTGVALAFARGLGEYGSVVFIAGNKPFSTEIAPLMIMAQLQEFDYAEATAIALTMLIISFALLFTMNAIQVRAARRTGGA
ncbi:MAG: ABC transporter permease subunit, partial [Eubacteriales bacterium]|nr:ABC transporter permease subunit [Eubacteriales bacterium]